MAVVRCSEREREFINKEIERNSKNSPYIWTQETMVNLMAQSYRSIDKIRVVLRDGGTYGEKVKTIEELV